VPPTKILCSCAITKLHPRHRVILEADRRE